MPPSILFIINHVYYGPKRGNVCVFLCKCCDINLNGAHTKLRSGGGGKNDWLDSTHNETNKHRSATKQQLKIT